MENKFDTIIPLGETCNISFLLQNACIKHYTTLFEWFVTHNLNDITSVLENIIQNRLVCIQDHDGQLYIQNKRIYTGHYSAENFRDIYDRRKIRMVAEIIEKRRILFIRFETSRNVIYSKDNIDDFLRVISLLNTNTSEMKLLLIRPDSPHPQHPFLVNKFMDYDLIHADPYCTGDLINIFLRIF